MDIDNLTLSFSSLKQFSRSPAHFAHYKKREFKQSAAMRRGWLTHLLVLEPEKILELHVLDVATRANKLYKEALTEHGADKVFTTREVLEAQNLVMSIKEHPLARKLIQEATSVEQHIKWSMDGVKFHGYADIIGRDFIADLKIMSQRRYKDGLWIISIICNWLCTLMECSRIEISQII